jgi:hydrogenase maturation factor
MGQTLPVGKLDMHLLSRLLQSYTSKDERVTIGPKVGEDAAVLDFGERYLVVKSNPITFATQEIGWYLVNVCVNNMVVRGVRPRWMLNTLLLPEGKTTPEMVEQIFRQIYEACRRVDVLIIGGHTEVTFGLDRPLAVGCLLGEIEPERLVPAGGAQPGDTVLVTKYLAIEGTAILAREKQEALLGKGYDLDFIQRAQGFLYDPGISVYEEALAAAETGLVHAMTDATEGGLATALHELAEAGGVGLQIEAASLPVRPETQRICAEFGLDPLGLIASGMLILTAPQQGAEEVCRRIAERGIACTAIGRVTPGDAGRLLSREGRLVELPYYPSDELTRAL